MKKMLSTTLVAIAFAMVSTVDAKVMKSSMTRKDGSVTTSREVAIVAADVVDEQPVMDVQMPTEVQKVLSAQNLSEDEREYAVLKFQLEDTNNRIAFRKEQRAGLKYGLFGFFQVPADKKAEYDRLTSIINNLENDKKQITADMAALNVGSKFATSMKLAFLAVSAYITGSVVNQLLGGKPATLASDYVVTPVKDAIRTQYNQRFSTKK
jgi:hypothetical protein